MVGVPTPDPNVRRRINALEATVKQLESTVDRLRRSPAERNNSREVFVAQTAEATTYPTAPANVFGLIFQTVSFTRSEGSQTPTYTAHSSSVQDYGLSLVGYIPEDTYVLVKKQRNGQYVIIGQATETGSCVTVLDGIVLDDLSASTPAYVLAIDSSGCLIKVAVGTC